MPEPGYDIYSFLGSNTRFPPEVKEMNISASFRVFVKFVVDRNGKITNIGIAKGSHPALNDEAVRVVSTLPNWKPAVYKNRPISVYYTLPISFRLE